VSPFLRAHLDQDAGLPRHGALLPAHLAGLLILVLVVALAGCGGETSGDGSGEGGGIVDPAALPGRVMDFETACNFFPPLKRPAGRMMWDSQAWVVLRPDRDQFFDWPEHPAGRIRFRTNNLGLREDVPTDAVKQGPRVLVTGDSQTEGAVNNAESWPNALERLLSSGAPASGPAGGPAGRPAGIPAVEVLNAGVGGTGPHNHLGMLRRELALAPDLFIAALYAGNDFQGALQVSDFLTKRHAAPRTKEYTARLDAANARWPEALPQGFNQAAYFAFAPGDATIALDAAIAVHAEMDAVCRAHGIRFLAVVIPSKTDVEPDEDRATVDEILAALSLSREELAVNERLGREFAAALAARGIACVDALAGLRGAGEPLYWRRDHHLDIAGNERLARVLAARVAELLAAPPPSAAVTR
jgi:hypothetical protein